MTIRSELFVATRRNALRFAARREAADTPEYVRMPGLGLRPDDLEALWAILLAEPFDPVRHQLENLRFGPRNPTGWRVLRRKLLILAAVARSATGGAGVECGLYRIPTAYVRLLAGLDDQALESCLTDWAWAASSGLEGRRLLEALRRLASNAIETGRPLFLWGETVDNR